jgi:hypothetical protein
LFIDLEHTGWSVATNDFGVFLSHGENLVDHGVGVHIVGEDLVLSENLLSEDLVQVQFLEDGVLVKVVLDEVILEKGILNEVILVKGVLEEVILDKFFLDEFILDELFLKEFFLDEFILDKLVLDEIFLDEFILDDLVLENFWNADDLSINDLDVIEGHFWLSGDGIEDLSFNILGHNLNVGDDFSNWGLVQKEITVDFLQQVFVVDVVDIESLLSVVFVGEWENFTFNVDETVLVQSLDSTEVIEEVDVVTGDAVNGANEFGVDSTDLFDFNLQGLDLWVDVLVEENWVSEVLLELTGGPELLEEWRSNVLLEDWVLHVLLEEWDGHVLTEEFSGVQFFDGVDGVHAVSGKTLNKGKVDTFGLVGGQRKSTEFSELSSEFSIEKSLLLQLKELLLLQQGQRSSGDGGHEESDSDESLHVERASLFGYPK